MPLDNVENALLVKLNSRYLSSKNFSIRGVLLNQTIIIHFLFALLLFCRLSMTLSCSMTFHDFPMDKQTCFLNITSCKYLDCLSPHADPCRPLPLSPAPWGTSKTILIFFNSFLHRRRPSLRMGWVDSIGRKYRPFCAHVIREVGDSTRVYIRYESLFCN